MIKSKLRTEYEARFGVVAGYFKLYDAEGNRIYFETDNGAGIRCFINGDFTSEELYEGKDIAFASAAAQRWVAGINTLNG